MKLFLLLFLLAFCASAQKTSILKYQVYSNYLNAKIASADSLMDTTYVRKSRSLAITPVTSWDIQEIRAATDMIRIYLHSKGIRQGVGPIDTTISAKDAAQMLDFWPQSWPKGNLRSWLDAGPENVRLYFQWDSLFSVHQKLQQLFQLNYPVLIASSPAKFFNKKLDWDAYYRRYPGSYGIVSVSEVAFTTDKRRAIFYVAERQGGLAGGGNIIFMMLTAHGWEVEFTVNLWVS